MRKTFIYRLAEPGNIIRKCISNHTLPSDIDDIVVQVLESLLGAVLMQNNGVHDTIVTLVSFEVGFAEIDDTVGRVLQILDTGVVKACKQATPPGWGVVTYDVTKYRDAVIYVEPLPQPTLLDTLRDEVQSDLDAGGWYPENFRRFIGAI